VPAGMSSRRAAGCDAVKGEGEVGFGEVVVAADLGRIGDLERDRLGVLSEPRLTALEWRARGGERPKAARLISI
jgi:hypothetical protein